MNQSPKQHINNILKHAEDYLDTQIEILKMQGVKHSSRIIAFIAAMVLIGVVLVVFYFLINLAIVFCINGNLKNLYYSFIIVGLSNLFLVIILVIMRRVIMRGVQNIIIKLITE